MHFLLQYSTNRLVLRTIMGSIKARLALLLFLGSVFLAVASVGIAEEANSEYRVCVKSCAFQNDASGYFACHARCKVANDREEKEEAAERDPRLPDPRRPWQPKEKEEGREEESESESEEEQEPQWKREREQEERGRHDRRRRPGKEEEQEGQGQGEQEQEEQKQQRDNPYYLPNDMFQTRFENEHGRIRVLQRFDDMSQNLRMLRYYRIVEIRSRPGTLIGPKHSDAEYIIINTRGRALVTIVLPNYRESFNLKQFDVLRVPAGAICYTINQANDQDLELLKLALPVNNPGQFENFYPSGNHIPQSYFKAFKQKTLQAAFNAPYDEIEKVLWGSEQQEQQGQQGSEEGVIVKLQRDQLRSLISRLQQRARSSSSREEQKKSPLGPFNLRHIEPRMSNNHGSLREAHPHLYQSLQDLGIGVSHLKLNKGSLFLPHYNTRAIVLGFVASGEGHTEIACPHLANQQQQQQSEGEEESENRLRRQQKQQQQEGEEEQEQEHKEGQFKRLNAKLSQGDLFIVPAGHPVAVRATKNNNLEVVEFVLNAPYNFRNFVAGKEQNVLNEIDREVKEAAFAGNSEQIERLFNRQRQSFFVNRENQPSGGGNRPPREGNKVARSFLTAFT